MNHRLWLAGVVIASLGAAMFAPNAMAAEVSDISGSVSIDGDPVTGDTATLEPGQTVNVLGEGSSATVTTANGDVLDLGPGTELVLESTGEEGEIYVLRRGSVLGTITTGTAISNGRRGTVAAGESGSAELFAEVADGGNRTSVRVRGGSAQLTSGAQFETVVGAGQGAAITYRSGAPSRLQVQTDSSSSGEVKVTNHATRDLDIEIYVPANTRMSTLPDEVNDRTEIRSHEESAREGRVRVVSMLEGAEIAEVDVAPSLSAFVNHASGQITLGYVKLDWTVLVRAISLTSEFQTLAVSNFTGVLSPDASSNGGGESEVGVTTYTDDFGYYEE